MQLPHTSTICALSTPAGVSALAIIRLCGTEALAIGQKVFTGKLEAGKAAFGSIKDGGETIDEVVESRDYSYANVVLKVEEVDDHLGKLWSPVSHMNSVVSTDALREALHVKNLSTSRRDPVPVPFISHGQLATHFTGNLHGLGSLCCPVATYIQYHRDIGQAQHEWRIDPRNVV